MTARRRHLTLLGSGPPGSESSLEVTQEMKWLLSALLICAAPLVACGGGAASVGAKPPAAAAPVIKYQNSLPAQTASGPFDLVMNVLDFAPGAASVVHTHSTPNLATVLMGEITVKSASGDRHGSVGGGLVEPLNEPVQAVNATSQETMVAVAFAVPHGGKATAPVAGKPAPQVTNKTLYTFTDESLTMPGGFSIVQQVLEFAPGSQTPKHRDGGPGVVTVLEGQLTLDADGVARTYNVGESFTELPGLSLQASNRGGDVARVVESFALPAGAQLTTKV
jgi:quercetin dioxygenase-like cupin family protein